MTGTLYIVATPIGNLEDITLRSIDILSDADVILAEDTRVTGKLLEFIKAFRRQKDLKARILSYHQHSSEVKKLEILKHLLDGKNVALVTDAGTPGISDPGNELIFHLTSQLPDLKIVPIPGPSALTTALSVSGMNVNKFVFLGFFPKKHRARVFAWLKEGKIPFVFYESPFRIVKTLNVLNDEFGQNVQVFVARELTKIHETLYKGSVSEVLEKLANGKPKGEIVVLVLI